MAMNKRPTDYLKYFWPMRHYLVTCGTGEEANIIAVSFCMPVSKAPPMVACAIGHGMYSGELIEATGEFIVNVPPMGLKRHINYCGRHSGRDVDKFQATGLTPLPARRVSVPIIAECVAHMECRVTGSVDAGDKRLFLAEVLDAYADEEIERGLRTVEYAAGEFPEWVYGGRFGSGASEE
jgi:flavin reductase (DIM6/NTAB) family NADH-FMN oxidoreductase RutF